MGKADIEPLPAFAAPAWEKHAIFSMDGVGSSAGFHTHEAVWNTQVTGRKAWFLMPPSVEIEGKFGPPKVNGHVYDHPNACEFLQRQSPPLGSQMCILEPGQTLLLP